MKISTTGLRARRLRYALRKRCSGPYFVSFECLVVAVDNCIAQYSTDTKGREETERRG